MIDNNDKTNQLLEKLESLLKRQNDFSKEINNLRMEINILKNVNQQQSETQQGIEIEREVAPVQFTRFDHQINQKAQPRIKPIINRPPKEKSDVEKFIGQNLINIIGIVITIIGVAIGAKYSIENDLISPLTRIIIGYLFGLVLLGVGIKLKRNYHNYSAVLVSGAMAIMYFITYLAFSFYFLIPQVTAFLLMVFFTLFTVIAAINYNRQIIAHIGLIGGYAVPFLLSDGSGRVEILFSYMTILNIGILAIAFKKYWKSLYYFAFGLTWVMYFVWSVTQYQTNAHFGLALLFLTVFFVIFYLIFLGYKLIQKEMYKFEDIILLIANSFIFYGLGYSILVAHPVGEQLLGLFTLCNAIVHFIVSVIVYRQKLADKNLFYLISGLVLVFITIAFPVQFDGNWVTLLWTGEATLLFWIGRTKNVSFYEKLSYPLMLLALISLTQDWATAYHLYDVEISESRVTPILNINLLSSLLFVLSFGFISKINSNKNFLAHAEPQKGISTLAIFIFPAIAIFALYYAFRLEISNYWSQLYLESALTIQNEKQGYPDYFYNNDLVNFETIWLIIYTMFFVIVLAFVNIKRVKNQQLGLLNLGLIVFVLITFLSSGLFSISELRESYLQQNLSQYYHRGSFNIVIRYLSFAFVAITLVVSYKYIRQDFIKINFNLAFDFLLYTSVLIIVSSELMNWMDMSASSQSDKLGLSILWGIYSLFLIIIGIWKKKKYLRIGAMILFSITLIKLFLYDISELDTIAKTIVFVSLGVLLLIISFLYNKYKRNIDDEVEN